MSNSNYQICNVNFRVKPLAVLGSLLSKTLHINELYLKVGTKIGTQSVQRSSGFLKRFKIKDAKTKHFRIFLVGPEGLEPPTR